MQTGTHFWRSRLILELILDLILELILQLILELILDLILELVFGTQIYEISKAVAIENRVPM